MKTLNKLLRIDASLQSAENSASKKLGNQLVEQLNPEQMWQLDLAQTPLALMDEAYLQAVFSPEPTAEQAERLATSDRWIERVQQADALVITTPMYNFGVPANLKNFFDHILRAGKTFKYTSEGPQGLLEDKPVFLVLASGGDYREGPAAQLNYLDGHLITMLNFIGLKRIYPIHAAGLSTTAAANAIEEAESQISTLIQTLQSES